jgi:omega-hydroxy-beta-dihydromenaquinone-9 sulfotransferase
MRDSRPIPGPLRRARYQLGLIGFARLGTVLRLAGRAPAVPLRLWPRLLLVVGSSLVILPLRWAQTLVWGWRIARTPVPPAPIFIIGHWRSGTTWLHNLLTRDPAFGSLTMYQAVVPDCSLIGGRWLQRLLSFVVPLERPMDNMTWPMAAPQEDEIALAKTTPCAFYARFLFPGRAAYLFRRYVLFDGASPRVVGEVKRRYRRLLKIAALHAGGRTLVLKNPVNTARVPLLLDLFPDARFVHICRRPYDVFASSLHLERRLLPITALQRGRGDPSEAIFNLYEAMMRRYLADREQVAVGRLVEIRYEQLERAPLPELQRIYETFGLTGWPQMHERLAADLAAQKGYVKNPLFLTGEQRAQVDERWGFAFDAFGYARDDARPPMVPPLVQLAEDPA